MRVILILTVTVCFLISSSHNPEAVMNQALRDHVSIPSEYGQVIYRSNAKSDHHLYIVGMSHRDTFTRANGNITVQSQIEVYRIAEWLIQNEGLSLLLPEGFFSSKKEADVPYKNAAGLSLDASTLERRLGDDSVYTNAEMLLMDSYPVRSLQVEDMEFYNSVTERVRLLEENRNDPYQYLFTMSSLKYLEARRVAAMLQNIPPAIASRLRNQNVKNQKALFTIGMNHISEIIEFIKRDRIKIDAPAFSAFDDYAADLTLSEENYGITIIIPRTLADNHEILKLTKLHTIQ
jgi:hypothetical protein